MPRRLLVLLALLVVHAKPSNCWAGMIYDMPTGNVTIAGGGLSVIYLWSNSGALNPDNIRNPISVEPFGAFVPDVEINDGIVEMAVWSSFPEPYLLFEKLSLIGAIMPNTPVSDLTFAVIFPGQSIPVYERILVTPEPAGICTAAVGMLSLAALRCRK